MRVTLGIAFGLGVAYVAIGIARPRWVGFRRCPHHGWVNCWRRATCPICAAYGRVTVLK